MAKTTGNYKLKNILYTRTLIFYKGIIDGQIEEIQKQEVFDEVQKLMEQPNKKIKKIKICKNLIFGGLVKCRKCGTTMSATYLNKHTSD